MRVLLGGWFWGKGHTGSGQYLHAMYRTLPDVRPDIEIVLAVPEGTDAPPGAVSVSLPMAGISPDLAKVWFEQASLPALAKKLRADVLHVPYWAPPAFHSTPTVVTIHDLIPLLLPEYRGGVLGWFYTTLVSRTARRTDLILTDSDTSRQDILLRLHVPPKRVRRVWLAASPRYRPVRDEAALRSVRSKYGLPDRFFLYLGGFDIRKNVGTLLAAWKAYAEGSQSPVPLVVAGKLPEADSDFAPDPRRQAEELGIRDGVVFPGWIAEEDKPALYSAALAFAFPSRYEGFGLPVLEAMACGTAVLASDASSLPEVVGDAGVLLPPGDISAWSDALGRIDADKAWRKKLEDAALSQSARFSWEKAALETAQAYEAACSPDE